MGIYSNGRIFGIQIYTRQDDVIATLFEEKYDAPMSYQQMREAYLFYDTLTDKRTICFNTYNEYTCTHNLDSGNFMMWTPLRVDTFLQIFNV